MKIYIIFTWNRLRRHASAINRWMNGWTLHIWTLEVGWCYDELACQAAFVFCSDWMEQSENIHASVGHIKPRHHFSTNVAFNFSRKTFTQKHPTFTAKFTSHTFFFLFIFFKHNTLFRKINTTVFIRPGCSPEVTYTERVSCRAHAFKPNRTKYTRTVANKRAASGLRSSSRLVLELRGTWTQHW